MKSLVAAVFAVSLLGCAQEFVPKPNDLAVKDFTPSDDPMVEADLGGSDGGADLRAPDLALPDLAHPPDLSPVMCDLSTSDAGTKARLYLAGIVSGNALATAAFDETAGWSAVAVDGTHGVVDVAITLGPGAAPLVVARQNDTGGTLGYTALEPCTGLFPPLVALYTGAATSNRPSLAGGATTDVVFRGMFDNHLYHSSFDGSSWTTGAQLALLTDQWPAAVRYGGAVHAIHTGTGGTGQLYDAPLGAATVTITGATSSQGPAAVTGADGTLYVVFTGMDTNLYWTKRAAGAGSFITPVGLCNPIGAGGCIDTSDKQPLVALGSDGKPIAIWHGTDKHLYTSTLTDGATPSWSAAIEATNSEMTTLLPAIATGIGAATAELVYVRMDGAARHTRLTSIWNAPTSIGNQTYTSTPALASSN